MEVVSTNLKDVWLIKPDIFTDFRGDYFLAYHEELYKQFGIKFVEHCILTASKGVLRGIHYSPDSWKLYQCCHGAIHYVFVNCEGGHSEFGKWQSFVISDRNHYQLIKHPRYGTGFLALEDNTVLHYMQSEYYNPDNPNQKTFKWNDERFNIWWPKITPEPILSQRDALGEYVSRT